MFIDRLHRERAHDRNGESSAHDQAPQERPTFDRQCLMTVCDVNVVANTSFSRWGAF
jgi:hypothetical protein